jgi:hypothetical protein
MLVIVTIMPRKLDWKWSAASSAKESSEGYSDDRRRRRVPPLRFRVRHLDTGRDVKAA